MSILGIPFCDTVRSAGAVDVGALSSRFSAPWAAEIAAIFLPEQVEPKEADDDLCVCFLLFSFGCQSKDYEEINSQQARKNAVNFDKKVSREIVEACRVAVLAPRLRAISSWSQVDSVVCVNDLFSCEQRGDFVMMFVQSACRRPHGKLLSALERMVFCERRIRESFAALGTL